MSITLEVIYKELQEIKKRLDQLERNIILSKEEFSAEEIEELNQISEQMATGDKVSWNPWLEARFAENNALFYLSKSAS